MKSTSMNKKPRRNDPKFPVGALFSQRLKYEKCPAFYFPPEIGVKIGVKMKNSKNMPRNVPILSTIHLNRGIINCISEYMIT